MSSPNSTGAIPAFGLALSTSHLPGPTSTTGRESLTRSSAPNIRTRIGCPRAASKPDPESEPEWEAHDDYGHVNAWRNGYDGSEEPNAPPTPARDTTLRFSRSPGRRTRPDPKYIWRLARSIPQDLEPVKLDPTIERFLQYVRPNEWRARLANRVPCIDKPLRTFKVTIQDVVAHLGDDVYVCCQCLSRSLRQLSFTHTCTAILTRAIRSRTVAANGNSFARHNRQCSEGINLRAASPPACRADALVMKSASVVSAEHTARRSSASPSRRAHALSSQSVAT